MKRNITYLLCLLFIIGCTTYYTGPKSDHFDGKNFFYPEGGNHEKSIADLIKWRMGDRETWPKWIDIEQQKVPMSRNESSKIVTTFINHSTVLLQINGLNILTDPIWSDRTSPVSFAGPKRVKLPGVKFDDLPKIDVVLISHNHYDHMDMPTLKKLSDRDRPLILMGLGSGYSFKGEGVENRVELDWNQSKELGGAKFIFTKNQHWSKRGLFDYNRALWGGFVIEVGEKKIYFGGDTGYGEFFKDIGKTYGPFDLALLPIGAYEPRWFMKFAHMNPEEAVMAHRDIKSKQSLGIHFGTFQLTDEGIKDPLKALYEQKKLQGVEDTAFVTLENGQNLTFE